MSNFGALIISSMCRIIGSFYLKKTEGGNLTGEFTNNVLFTVTSEYAVLEEAGDGLYVGRYNSTWTENGKTCRAQLIIERMPNTEKYKVLWIDAETGPVYTAEAFLAEGMLVGHFVSVS